MKPNQTLEVIPVAALLESVRALRARGARLVQICATALPGQFELTYSFDLGDRLASLRVHGSRTRTRACPASARIYACAFLYENEMHDLFNIKVEGMTVDFHGNLYNTAVKFAFGQTKPPAAKPQPAAVACPELNLWPALSFPLARNTRSCPNRSIWIWWWKTKRWSRPGPPSVLSTAAWRSWWKKRTSLEFVYVAERICGICSFIHGQTYCQAIEDIMDIPVPPRAHYLRTVWGELSRIHSHLLWLGLMADGMGFESLFMHSWRVRERVLDIIEATTGGRVIFGSCKIGGVRRDMDAAAIKDVLAELDIIERELREITQVFLNRQFGEETPVRRRGAFAAGGPDLGCVGPVLRASGVAQDMRQLGYAAYSELDMEPVTRSEGDSYARCAVRCDELFQSISLIRQALAKIPPGEIEVKVTGNPKGEVIMRTEQPRGEVVYCLKANGAKNLQRFRVRTPTFANLPAMLKLLQGCDLADVPVLVLTIDPCISCTER